MKVITVLHSHTNTTMWPERTISNVSRVLKSSLEPPQWRCMPLNIMRNMGINLCSWVCVLPYCSCYRMNHFCRNQRSSSEEYGIGDWFWIEGFSIQNWEWIKVLLSGLNSYFLKSPFCIAHQSHVKTTLCVLVRTLQRRAKTFKYLKQLN